MRRSRDSLSRRYLESYLVRNNRVSSSENSPRNRRTKSNFPSSATKGDFAWGVVPAIATGVAVTGACNDHSPLSSHITAIPSLPPPKPPPRRRPERTFTGNATCALCVEKMWVCVRACVRVYNAFDPTGMWGSGAFFVRVPLSTAYISRSEIGGMRFRLSRDRLDTFTAALFTS